MWRGFWSKAQQSPRQTQPEQDDGGGGRLRPGAGPQCQWHSGPPWGQLPPCVTFLSRREAQSSPDLQATHLALMGKSPECCPTQRRQCHARPCSVRREREVPWGRGAPAGPQGSPDTSPHALHRRPFNQPLAHPGRRPPGLPGVLGRHLWWAQPTRDSPAPCHRWEN